jgi:hypothetical protein
LNSLTVEKVDFFSLPEGQLPNPDEEASFNFTLVGYDRKEGPNITEINNEYSEPDVIVNLFNEISPVKRPVVKKTESYYAEARPKPQRARSFINRTQETSKPKNTGGLPEINNSCEVLAITPFSVLIKDATGKIIKLRKGDKIYGGTLTSVDAKSGKAVFQYDNKFGAKTFVLTMQK